VASRRRGRWIAEQDFTIMEIKSKNMNSECVILSIIFSHKSLLEDLLHSPFIFKGRGEEELGFLPDLTRCQSGKTGGKKERRGGGAQSPRNKW